MECRWRAHDVWRQAELGVFAGRYERRVPGHATHLVKFTPLSCGHLREGMDDIRDNAWRYLMRRDGAATEWR